MMAGRPRALVLSMYSGEQEFKSCHEALSGQLFTSFAHLVIEDLPNRQAHAELYRSIMAERANYDLFIKLDADMVLTGRDALSRIVACFEQVPDLDHLVFGVADWFTGADIIGLHAFSNRVSWETHDERLFVDPDPHFPGRKLVVSHPRPPLVAHSPDPSPFQAFQFGVHRDVKACQRGISAGSRQAHAARVHWSYLGRLWRHYRLNSDHRLGLAVLGADLVLGGFSVAEPGDRHDEDLRTAFEEVGAMSAEDVRKRLEPTWSGWLTRQLRWLRAMDRSMAVAIAARGARDAVTWPVRSFRRIRNDRLARRLGGVLSAVDRRNRD
jgi:hypothetical protein